MNQNLVLKIADHVPALVALYNIQTGKYLYVNQSVEKLLGFTPKEFIDGGIQFVASLVHEEDINGLMTKNGAALAEANKKGEKYINSIVTFEYRMRRKNGSYIWVQTCGSVFGRDSKGKVELILNVTMDITDLKKSQAKIKKFRKEMAQSRILEKQLKESEERFRNLVEAVEDYAIFALDSEGFVVSWNEGVEYILGYKQEDVLGRHYSEFFTNIDRINQVPEKELDQARRDGYLMNEGLRLRKDGSAFHAVVNKTAVRDESGVVKGFSAIIRDVTEKKEAEETILYQAYHDPLTGLVNRKALDEKFLLAQSEAIREHHKVAILFLDLDRFKNINDTLGHVIGDLILKEVADRLISCVNMGDTVARLGGDEFIILLNNIHQMSDVVKVAQKILESLELVMRVQDQSIHISASIGITMYPDDGNDVYTLLKNSDTALYKAKDAGRNRYRFYNQRMNLLSVARFSLEQDLRTAIGSDQLKMAYQPFIEVTTGKIIGVEALVRWQHPKMGLLYPSEFIPIAEENGLIVHLGTWILKTVCRQAKAWYDNGKLLRVTVNLSAHQFAEHSIVETVTSIVKETKLEPSLLELEITESVAMENITRTSTKLNNLKRNGITIAIDDFGIGYSSLSYLKRFPVHKLKIDKTFIQHAVTDPQDVAILRAIISMGHSLGLKVCVEGIEQKQQLDILNSMECSYVQGYYICKPLFAEELGSWFTTQEAKIISSKKTPLWVT